MGAMQLRQSSGERQTPRQSYDRDLLRWLDAGVKEGRAPGKGKSPDRVTLETCIGGSMQESKKGELWGKAKVRMEFRKRPVSEVRCRSQRRESSGERQKPRESHESDLHRRFDAGAKEGRAPGERHKKPRTLSERNEAKRWAAREVGSPSRSPGTGSDACKYLSEGSQGRGPGVRQKPRMESR